jgi:hypothetical protein
MKRLLLTLKLSIATAILGLSVLSAAPVSVITPSAAAAGVDASKKAICEGAGLDSAECNGKDNGLSKVISNIVNVLSVIIGVVAVIMVIISGLRYITSGGDATKLSGAKSTLIYALVGLVIVALAQVIVHFVLARAT